MRRHKLALSAILSLILCATIVALWIRSYWISDDITTITLQIDTRTQKPWNTLTSGFRSSCGWFAFWKYTDKGQPNTFDPIARDHAAHSVDLPPSTTWKSGPNPLKIQPFATRFGGGLAIPYWLPALLTAIAPALWLRRWRAQRRQRLPGHCRMCGYDVRATPQAGGPLLERCPECGAATAVRANR